MASNRNDEMDRNRTTPQGSTPNATGGTHGNTTQGSTSGSEIGRDMNRDRQEQGRTTGSEMGRTTGTDAVNRDREMNRDTKVGQGSSGSGQSGRESFGSDKSKDTGRGPNDTSE